MYWYVLTALACGTLIAAVITGLLFRNLWVRPGMLRSTAMNLALSGYALAFTLLGLEVAAREFIVFPDGFNISLASKRWFERYWNPINSMGVRGTEPNLAAFAKGPSLLFLGDSFTAGSGLEDYRDRFSEQVKKRAGGQWAIETLAIGGWDTDKEFEALQKFPVKPQRVLLQYYLNDIGQAVREAGVSFSVRPTPLPLGLQWLSDRSYLLNFVHLQVFRAAQLAEKVTYWDLLRSQYEDPKLWALHEAMLRKLITYCKDNNIALDMLIFPNLFDVDGSRPIVDKVKGVFESMGVQVINLADTFQGRNPMESVVNVSNAHPNAKAHHEVADIIIQRLGL
jgi:hypothetical protein